MAEYVEQRMEEMLGEVEQMERVNLLEPKEVKELIKKRKHFEYKIQKKSKEKGDFLGYIQYETNLLSLLAMRRESTGYEHKKSEIEGGIRVRINKLFKILEHRFQSDVSIWLSHIQFLKSSGWEASVSRIYLRMLQVDQRKRLPLMTKNSFRCIVTSLDFGWRLLSGNLRLWEMKTMGVRYSAHLVLERTQKSQYKWINNVLHRFFFAV